MIKTQRIRRCIYLMLCGIGAGIFYTLFFYPFLDSHRGPGVAPFPPLIYILTWVCVLAITGFMVYMNIRSYTHASTKKETKNS